MLSQKAIAEFKAIIKEEFDIEMTDAEAEQRAREVLEFFWLVFVESDETTGRTSEIDQA